MTTNQTILHTLIQKSGLTKKDYLYKHKILQRTLDRWLNGTRIVSLQRLEQLAKEDEMKIVIKIESNHCVNCGYSEITDFLNEEICERRDYSASKMCEVIREFIGNLNKK